MPDPTPSHLGPHMPPFVVVAALVAYLAIGGTLGSLVAHRWPEAWAEYRRSGGLEAGVAFALYWPVGVLWLIVLEGRWWLRRGPRPAWPASQRRVG